MADSRSRLTRARRRALPTLNAYCAAGASERSVQIALQRGPFRHVWRSWVDVEAFGRDMVPLIAIVPRMTQDEFENLRHFRERFRGRPLVVVIEKDAETARMLGRLDRVEVVWASEVDSRLAVVVRSLEHATIFARLAESIVDADSFDQSLCDALVAAMLQSRPVRSVDQLAKIAMRSPSTLHRAWTHATLGREGLRLKDLLDWLLLLRAVQRRESGGDWSESAGAVGVDVRTLGRIALRLTRKKLDHIAAAGFSALADRCFDEIQASLNRRTSKEPCHGERADALQVSDWRGRS